MLLTLELWKKNGNEKNNASDTANQKKYKPGRGPYEVLGYFDNLKLSDNKTFEKVLGYYDEADLQPSAPYNRYMIPLFTIDGIHPKGKAPLCNKGNGKRGNEKSGVSDQYLYQVTLFKINPEILFGHISGMELFKTVGNVIVDSLKENLDFYIRDEKKNPSANKVSYSILGGMGSFDFALICGVKASDINTTAKIKITDTKIVETTPCKSSRKEVINVWHAVQRIPNVLRRLRDEGHENHSYFDFSTTFFTCSPKIDFEKGTSPDCCAEIKMSCLHCRSSAKDKRRELMRASEKASFNVAEDTFTVFSMHGDEDLHINFKGPLFHLLFLFGKGKPLDIDNDHYIREFHTYFFNKNPPLEYSDLSNPHSYPEVQNYITELSEKYARCKNKISDFSQNTMEDMIYACKFMLNSDSHAVTGMKMFSLLTDLLDKISRTDIKIEDKNQAIQDFSYMVPVNLQHHSVRLYDQNDVDWISPISKILYAYEHFITLVQSKMSPPEVDTKIIFRELNIFLTIGHTDQILSKEYFDEYEPDEKSSPKRLIAFNLPSIRALIPALSYCFLVHEAGHYGLLSKNYGARNESFYHTLMRRFRNSFLPEDHHPQEEEYWNHLRPLFDEQKEKIADKNKLRLSAYSHRIEELPANVINVCGEKQSENIDYTILVDGISKFDWKDAIQNCKDLIFEIYADAFMIAICELDFDQYIDLWLNFFSKNLVSYKTNEYWTLRMGVVYTVLAADKNTCRRFPANTLSSDKSMDKAIKIVMDEVDSQFEIPENVSGKKSLLYKQLSDGLKKEKETIARIAVPIAIEFSKYSVRRGLNASLIPTADFGKSKFENAQEQAQTQDMQMKFFLDHWLHEMLIRHCELLGIDPNMTPSIS